MLKKYQNLILFISFILITFFASVIYQLELFNLLLPFTFAGTVLFLMMYILNNLYRLTKWKFLLAFTTNMYFYGMLAFVLLLAHEAKFSIAMDRLYNDPDYYPRFFLEISFYLFLLIIPMTITSFEKYRPKNWKIIQRIAMWSSLPLIIIHLLQVDYYFWALLLITPILLSVFNLFFEKTQRKVYLQQIGSFLITVIIFSMISFLLFQVLFISLIIIALISLYVIFQQKYEIYHSIAYKMLLLALFFIAIFILS